MNRAPLPPFVPALPPFQSHAYGYVPSAATGQFAQSPAPLYGASLTLAPAAIPAGSLGGAVIGAIPWWVWAIAGGAVAATGVTLYITYQNQKRLRTALESEVIPALLEAQAPGYGGAIARAAAKSR